LINFNNDLKIEVIRQTKTDLEVEIEGIDAPFANALRRILIAEVPSIAIDKAVLYQNTSIMHDEVLCHRLGLIPILADPELFNYKAPSEEFNETNSLKFRLHVQCTRKKEYLNST
jgi:DNA-directed RNA polymerases I and III subunit RPAC1